MNDWINSLAHRGVRLVSDVSGCLGVDFGTPHADTETLAQGVMAIPLLHLGLIRATGIDAADFLNKMLSNDLPGLAADAAQWTSFNTAQGRMLANFLLWRVEDGLSLALSADLTSDLLKKLSFYILRAKVKLALPEPERALIGLVGPAASICLARAGLPALNSDMQQAAADDARLIRINAGLFVIELPADGAASVFEALCAAGAKAGGMADWRLATIRAGLPCVTAATQGAFVPQMLNFEALGGISFTKGCYPGQEVVARTQHLGKTKRRMFRLILSDAPAAGMPGGIPLHDPESGEQAGVIVDFAPLPEGGEALAVLQIIHARPGGELHVGAPDGPRARII
ncbi:MAG: folate-binding protein [Azoarcus sp.]|jgi:folate-binding protein YgfZ|nr:folate-binding protein [Azoarcus sp.]